MIQGESGTGKEVVARAIQQSSLLHDKPFVTINCAALPEQLVESELFGYQKGSFTRATADKPGLFEIADGITILDLPDEIRASVPDPRVPDPRVPGLRVVHKMSILSARPLASATPLPSSSHLHSADGNSTLKLDDIAKAHVLEVLAQENGNQARAARKLGIHRRKLYRLLERFEAATEES